MSNLHRKIITDKNGHRKTVWVRNDEAKKVKSKKVLPPNVKELDKKEYHFTAVANLGAGKKTKENLDNFDELQSFMNKMKDKNAISVDVQSFDSGGAKRKISYDWDGEKWTATNDDVKQISPKEPRKMDKNLSDLSKELFAKVKREAAGKGKEIKLEKVEIKEILTKGKVGIISAGASPQDDPPLSNKEVIARDKALKADLVKMGLKFTRAVGKYGEVENSYMVFVPEIEKSEVNKLGTKYNQDSVIFSDHGNNEVIYTTGKNKGLRNVGKGFKEEKDSVKDFYTSIKTSNGNMKFNLDINWDNFIKSFINLFRK